MRCDICATSFLLWLDVVIPLIFFGLAAAIGVYLAVIILQVVVFPCWERIRDTRGRNRDTLPPAYPFDCDVD